MKCSRKTGLHHLALGQKITLHEQVRFSLPILGQFLHVRRGDDRAPHALLLFFLRLDLFANRLKFLGKDSVVGLDFIALGVIALGLLDEQHRQDFLREFRALHVKIKSALFVVVDNLDEHLVFPLAKRNGHRLLPRLGIALGFLGQHFTPIHPDLDRVAAPKRQALRAGDLRHQDAPQVHG